MFPQLVVYTEEHRDCLVPEGYSDNPALGRWVSKQRTLHNKNDLNPERKAALDALRFEWDQAEADWQHRFPQLEAFRAVEGHCLVPYKHGALGAWVKTQRRVMSQGGMKPHRQKLLGDIGFVWSVQKGGRGPYNNEQWQAWLELLLAYKAEYGNCRVPDGHVMESGELLGRWVSLQRTLLRKGRLREDRAEALHEAGFVWDPLDEQWQAMLEELCAFKEQTGHCRVSSRDKEHNKLGRWADTQRVLYNKQWLGKKRWGMLESLGFPWSLRGE
mmetsp:Transcript_18665/g.47160  ORF Transcript_18665/g.47160 Transcript_18665/m.47160 type:complete len:272 (+) Transcript_18665:830-1645(+)